MYNNRKIIYSFTILPVALLFFSFPLEVFGENKVFETQISFEKPADFAIYQDNLHSEGFELNLLNNKTDLCPTDNCKYEFIDDDYIMGLRFQNNEQLVLTGALEVYPNKSSSDTTTIASNTYGVHGIFQLIDPFSYSENNELIKDPKRIEGTLNIGKKVFSAPEFEYDINGTIKEMDNDLVLSMTALK